MKTAVLTSLFALALLAGCKSPNSGTDAAAAPDAYDLDITQVKSFCTTSQIVCAPYCVLTQNQGCYAKDKQAYRCTCPTLAPTAKGEKSAVIPAQNLCVENVRDCPNYCKADATSKTCPDDGHPPVSCVCPAMKIKGG